ncbi:unnamed protein product [Diamesa serratosioi]
MPAIRIFGRKWLIATDDLVFPCLIELLWRTISFIFMSIVMHEYWLTIRNEFYDHMHNTAILENPLLVECLHSDILHIAIYLFGFLALMITNLVILIVTTNQSAKGSITDTKARSHVTSLLYVKLFLLLPDVTLNIIGTMWSYSNPLKCEIENDSMSASIVRVNVVFHWVIFTLILIGIVIAYDPLGNTKTGTSESDHENNKSTVDLLTLKKNSKLWHRRFSWLFCCLKKDEYQQEAFDHATGIVSDLFRGIDLVPSDIMSGSVLMRVKQKMESQTSSTHKSLYSQDLQYVFENSPSWMNLKNAQHFLRFAIASYGWPLICYIKCCCPFQLIKRATCCPCFKSNSQFVVSDNCCLCNLAGVKYVAHLKEEDVVYASFKNQVFELPFCILADNDTKSVVISIRGSWSMRDILTDLTATTELFDAIDFPTDSFAHCGMSFGCQQMLKRLNEGNLLDRVMDEYPEYKLVITGHSLGAGVSILLGAKLRSKYSDLRVYAFATPAGLLTRDAARVTENFAFTLGIGDDFVMRSSIDAINDLRTNIVDILKACKLPKYRVMLNAFRYSVFGIPSSDFKNTWFNVTETSAQINHPQTFFESHPTTTHDQSITKSENTKLYTGGKILHIISRKKTELEKKNQLTYEMKWAQAEDFCELKVMPRMFLDHFPQNIFATVTNILNDKINTGSVLSVNKL